MNFSNISFVQQTAVNSVICFFYVCIYFFVFSVCTFYAFRHEAHLLFFSVLLCFLLYLINKFCNFFTFYITIF